MIDFISSAYEFMQTPDTFTVFDNCVLIYLLVMRFLDD